jgi:hypothetical protein
MKRIILLNLMALTCLSSSAQKAAKVTNANKPFYMRVGFCYGLAMSGQIGDGSGTLVSVTNEENFNIQPYSYGAGLSGTLALGYTINKNIGVEMIATSTLAGRKYEYTSVDLFSSGGTTYTEKAVITSHGNTLLLQPSVVVQTGGAKTNIYARMGIIVPIMNLLVNDVNYNESVNNNVEKTTEEYSMYFSLGASGAMGASINLTHDLRLYTELCMVSYTPYLAKGTRTEYTRNGVNYLSYLSLSDREIEFEKTGKLVASQDPDKPTISRTQSIPFSNIGINAGVVIQL